MARAVRPSIVLAAALALGAGACALPASTAPEWVALRRPLPLCGEEAGGFDVEARRCLLTAWQARADAELISHAETDEGDPRVEYLRVHANGTIELFVDATGDPNGSGEWERWRCARLAPATEPRLLIPDGCEALPLP